MTRLLVSTGKGVLCRVDESPAGLGFFEIWPDFVELHVRAPARDLPPCGETIIDLDALPSYAPTPAQLERAVSNERRPSEREQRERRLRHREVDAFRAWHRAYGEWMQLKQTPDAIVSRAIRWQRWRGVRLFELTRPLVMRGLPQHLHDVVPERIQTVAEAQIRAAVLARDIAPEVARLERNVAIAQAHWEAVRFRGAGLLIAA